MAGTRYEVKYPEGIGIPVLSKDTVIIANLHYTNPFQPQQPIYGESWLNMYFYKANEFKVILDGIFAINSAISSSSRSPAATISRIWKPRDFLPAFAPVDASIFQLFGHMHKRATMFQIDYVRDGACSVTTGALCGRDADCACAPGQTTCQSGRYACEVRRRATRPSTTRRRGTRPRWWTYQKPYLR